jgi:hypothetical protein
LNWPRDGARSNRDGSPSRGLDRAEPEHWGCPRLATVTRELVRLDFNEPSLIPTTVYAGDQRRREAGLVFRAVVEGMPLDE